jgi:hypothetical protein
MNDSIGSVLEGACLTVSSRNHVGECIIYIKTGLTVYLLGLHKSRFIPVFNYFQIRNYSVKNGYLIFQTVDNQFIFCLLVEVPCVTKLYLCKKYPLGLFGLSFHQLCLVFNMSF